MSGWCKNLALTLILVSVGCGETKTETQTVPTPEPIPSSTPEALPLNPPEKDPRLPDLTGAIAVNLEDKSDVTGLKDIASNVFLPLVGDPLLVLKISKTRETSISGTFLFSFEDQFGFWAASLSSFPGTGFQTNGNIDIIFADDEVTFRVIGSTQGSNDLLGLIYYRMRKAADTACRQVIISCEGSYPPYCYSEPDTATPCRNYMNSAQVKKLGTFKTTYSHISVVEDPNEK